MEAGSIHCVTLNSIHESQITNISLYTNLAQVTRSYRVAVAAGTMKLMISCLPNVVDSRSIRVEGCGAAIIQGVTAFKADQQMSNETSSLLEELNDKKTKAYNSQQRYQKNIDTIDSYFGSVSIEHLDILKLGEAMDIYDATEEKWENKLIQATKEIHTIDELIAEERRRLQELIPRHPKLKTSVAIGLYAVRAAELDILLSYAVSRASWKAGYDVRVNMQTKDAPVKVTYKAAINQRTGEDWQNAPITLETTRPTTRLELPSLRPWNISHRKTPSKRTRTRSRFLDMEAEISEEEEEEEDEDEECEKESASTVDGADFMEAEVADVTSKGNVNATFRIPGLSTIPSDEEEHHITIADLELEAIISWACVPKCDTKVYLESLITNSSGYTFIPGPGDIHVDQSFVSRSDVPGVSLLEVFRCPLGIDPSIKVDYLPQEKRVGESGFYTKSLIYKYTQRISIHNTKPVAIDRLRITDNIPVSQDAHLTVSLISPALNFPSSSTAAAAGVPTEPSSTDSPISVKVPVSDSATAMWKGADELGMGKDMGSLGKDGKIDWICVVPPLGRVNLLLQWEVATTLVKTEIIGL